MEYLQEADVLRDAFVAARGAMTYENLKAVERAVCALVDVRKAVGGSVQAIILQVRDVADSQRIVLSRDGLTSDAVRWCMDRYYEPGADALA